jgi:leucyl-tRNA synthetase
MPTFASVALFASENDGISMGNLLTVLLAAAALVINILVGIKNLSAKSAEKESVTRGEFSTYKVEVKSDLDDMRSQLEKLVARISENITRREFETAMSGVVQGINKLEEYARSRNGKLFKLVHDLQLSIVPYENIVEKVEEQTKLLTELTAQMKFLSEK